MTTGKCIGVLEFLIVVVFALNGTAVAQDQKQPAPGEVRQDNVLGMSLVWCPPGRFKMGSPSTESGRSNNEDQVETELTHGFWIGKYEVQQCEWERLMNSTPWHKFHNTMNGDRYPVNFVTRDDALEFCMVLTEQERKAGRLSEPFTYRLPTEAEWEYACRGGTTTSFCFGDDEFVAGKYAWYDANTKLTFQACPQIVGQKQPNRFGLYDMHGNVREWCWDWYTDRLTGDLDPAGPNNGDAGIARGGSWYDAIQKCRSASRTERLLPVKRNPWIGFRVVRGHSLGDAKTRNVGPARMVKLPPPKRPAKSSADPSTLVVREEAVPRDKPRNDNALGIFLVWCPPGKFKMGRTDPDEGLAEQAYEAPVDVVLTRGFWIGKYEITQEEWERMMGTRPFLGFNFAKSGRRNPASNLSWDDAIEFCDNLTSYERIEGRLAENLVYRLPTEAEWEYACRAGSKTRYCFGDDDTMLSNYGWFQINTQRVKEMFPHEVGSKRANGYGLHDMHGNVREWCMDSYNSTPLIGGIDPINTAPTIFGISRVTRGGSWLLHDFYARSSSRYSGGIPNARIPDCGFRIVLSVPVNAYPKE